MIRGGLVALHVKDVAVSVRFYIETLGMKLVEEVGSKSAVLDAGDGFRIALHAESHVAADPSSVEIGLVPKVPLREAIAIFENRGVAFDVRDEGARTVARFRDPD